VGTESWTPDKRNLTGGSWTTNRPPLTGQTPAVRQAPPGTTALAGRLLTLDGKPLAGATVSIGSVRTSSDRLGQFLLAGVPAGHAVLRVDGASANSATRKFGLFDIGVDTAAKHTTVLPYPIWMSTLDTSHTVRFASPAATEVVVRTPAIPGLEVHLPKGAVVRDVYGKPVTELGITAIPVDRPPFPLPKSQVPVYFTVQPGSSYVFPTGARVVYPNYTHAAPGAVMDFWHYDPAGRGWFVYGHGKVTANGQQVTPNAGTEVYQFTGAMLISPGTDAPPQVAPVPGNDFQGGDPVDLATGVLATSQTDLTVTDTLPISVTRNYQHADTGRRDFGVGTTSAYGMYLYANQEWLDGQLILPGGGKLTYHRVSAGGTGGSDFSSAAMVADPTTPSEYAGSVLVWGDDGFEVRLRDGTTFVFGNEAPLRAIRDQYGNEITITRALAPADPDGRVRPKGPITQVTSPNGKWITFSYDSANRITGAQDITGRQVSYTYDAAGHLATATDPIGAVSSYTYDSAGRLATAKNPRGVTYLTNTYDSAGRVSKQTLADGGTYQFAYLTDAAGRVTETRVTDPRGTVRRITFNAQSFGLTDTRAYGTSLAQTTTITRDTANRPTSIADQLGRRTDFAYDTNANLASQTQLAGTAQARTESFVNDGPYDALTKHTDPLGRITTYTYATDSAPRKITDSAGRVTNVDTNAAGQPTTVTDPLGRPTTYGYAAGDLVSVTDPLGRITRQRLDGTGRRTAYLDPLGAVSSTGYDAADRPLTTTDPLGQVTAYEYDANDNLTAVTDPRSHKTTFTYDNLDRPATNTDPLGRSSTASYDAAGHLAAATDAAGNRAEYAYDALGRMTTASFGVTTSGSQSQLTYAYDAGNRLTSVVDSATGTTTLTPDSFDRITRISSPQGQVDYAFDAADQRTSMTVANQPAITYGYDPAGALASVTQGTNQVTLAYDGNGQRSALTLPDGISQQYAYDNAGQLTGIDYRLGASSIGNLAYDYDPRGLVSHVGGSFARSSLPAPSGPTTYDAADQRTDYQYDADGNLLSDGTNSYTWNARGQLAASTSGSQSSSYRYDGLDRRIGKTVGTASTSYLYDGVTAVQESAGDGTVTASMLTGGVDEVFTRTSGGTTRSLLTDRLGSTVAVADAGGALTGEYTYSPYGGTALDGEDGGNPTRFTGREDDGNGLYYYRSRYYSTSDQRFLSADPLGFNSGDSNLYAYVQGQPTRFADPTGMLPLDSPELSKRIYLGNGQWLNKATGNIEDQAGFARGPAGESGSGNARPEADPPAYPPIKPGSAGGPTSGKPFPESVKKQVLDENPDTCVYCHQTTDRPQVDHAIPRARGGDATLDNGQTACGHCNASKGKRDYPVNPPPGYRGKWPPSWW
jgi:RHS repeat-associated protein